MVAQTDKYTGDLRTNVLRWLQALNPIFLELVQDMRDVLHAVLPRLGGTTVLESEASVELRLIQLQSVGRAYLHPAVRFNGCSKLLVGPIVHATFLSPCANRRFDRVKVCRRRRGVAQSAS
jgi:hypothetical protein